MNKYTGVLGVYNCQGAAWNSVKRKNTFHQTNSEEITGYIKGRDVHLISDVAFDSNWDGKVALYSYTTSGLKTLPGNVALTVSLKVLEYEIFIVTPVKTLAPGFSFAPLGLIDMFNAGGAIEGLKYNVTGLKALVSMEVKGCGRFGAYSSTKPRTCTVGS
ncbi:putative galactinol--sucrose galactosyltransferase 6 [Sesamum alatum]|uniref:Galactinol--sucrose galactosyltransferase 6 n=1 Tax=Sesamum alatum TaxID=300844 RepID=A0AAE1XY55_9LAMI|nr:putative galactinol--sucrose galactosyltransferase 6 [Sesamum alatum]